MSLVVALNMLFLACNTAVHSERLLLHLIPGLSYHLLYKLQLITSVLVPQGLYVYIIKSRTDQEAICPWRLPYMRMLFAISLLFVLMLAFTRMYQFQVFLTVFQCYCCFLFLLCLLPLAKTILKRREHRTGNNSTLQMISVLATIGTAVGTLLISWGGLSRLDRQVNPAHTRVVADPLSGSK